MNFIENSIFVTKVNNREEGRGKRKVRIRFLSLILTKKKKQWKGKNSPEKKNTLLLK